MESLFNKIRNLHRPGVRHGRLAANNLVFVELACTRLQPHLIESTA